MCNRITYGRGCVLARYSHRPTETFGHSSGQPTLFQRSPLDLAPFPISQMLSVKNRRYISLCSERFQSLRSQSSKAWPSNRTTQHSDRVAVSPDLLRKVRL